MSALEPILAACHKCGMALRCEGCSQMARDLGAARARIEELNRYIKNLEHERDLAVAHDRQPYPTATAYEAVCEANARKDKELIAAHNSLALAVNQRASLVVALRNILKSKSGSWRKIARDTLDALDNEMKAKD